MDHVARHAGLVAEPVRRVLERHPAVAGLGERAHHPPVQVAGLDLAHEAAGLLRRPVRGVELRTPQVGQLGHLVRVEQRPHPVGLDAAHELVGDPVGQVEVVGAPGVLAGVVAQLQELLDVRVPRFQVDAGGALAPAALVDRGDARVEGAQERHDAVGLPVGAADQRAARAHPGARDADAAGELRQVGDLAVALVDRAELVAGRVDQVAGGHLGVPGAGVEQRRRAGQVGQRRQEAVEADRLRGVRRQSTCDPQQPVLRRLHDQAGRRVPQQVPVVDGAQAEVLEPQVAARVHGVVELAGVGRHERGGRVADQAVLVAEPDRLAERGDALPAYLLVDVTGQQPRGQPRVLRLLADHLGGRLDRQPVELGGRRAVVQAADRPGRHPQGIYIGQSAGAAFHRPDDLVDVDRFVVAVALPDLHPLCGCRYLGDRHHSLLASSGRCGRGARRVTPERASAVPRGLGPPRTGVRGALAGLRTRGHRCFLLAVASRTGSSSAR